jgi:glucose uptake protein GlcU
MPVTSIFCGVLLILIGLVGYAYGLTTEHASLTALIPAAFGMVMAILGFAAKRKEGMRKHLMHAAVLIALIGFLMTAGRLLVKLNQFTLGAAAISQISTAIICLVFVILAVRSFVTARRESDL